MWNGHESNFNPEVEMKLLIADETVSNDPKQYKMLKKYSGTNSFVVNHKYEKPYEVKNNTNIIILSNANTPIYVEKDEQPTDESNNQFFVYSFHKFSEPIDPEMGMELKKRLGHYIRTELRDLYPRISTTGNRYSIKTPITEEEKLLFANNTTEVSDATDLFIERIGEIKAGNIYPELKGFVDLGYVPSKIFSEYLVPKGVFKVQIIKNLTDRGYIKSPTTSKEQINKERLPVYTMTKKLKEQLTS